MTETTQATVDHRSFVVRNIHCATCAETLRTTVASLPGVRRVHVDPTVGWTDVDLDPAVVSADELLAAVEAGGYEIVRTWN